MKKFTNQAGFSAVELLMIVAVLGLLGFVGYSMYNRQQNPVPNGTTQVNNEDSRSATVPAAPEIKSVEDLDKAQAALDQADPEAGNANDSALLDSQVEF